MTEKQWMDLMADRIDKSCISHTETLSVDTGRRLPYGYEIIEYANGPVDRVIEYQTDLIILESQRDKKWKPRIVLECKINSITTHDAITYSQKAFSHKLVHPYLRYGVILGNRKDYPLPGRLYRHGMFFDFMMSFKTFEPTEREMVRLRRVIDHEVDASRKLEGIIYESRKKGRDRYTLLHRNLHLE